MMKKTNLLKKTLWKHQNYRLAIGIVFELAVVLGIFLTYYFLPIFLNYGPGTINSDFDRSISGGLTYTTQFILIFIAISIIGIAFLFYETKEFKYIEKIKKDNQKGNLSSKMSKKQEIIIKKCMTLPQSLFVFISICPTLALSLIFLILGFTSFADMKVLLVIFIISMLSASILYIFFRNIFKSTLTYLGNIDKYDDSTFSLTSASILQLSSLLLVAIIYTFLLLQSSSMQEKSEILKKHYTSEIKAAVESSSPVSIEELQELLKKLDLVSPNDSIFLIDNSNEFISIHNSELSDFFKKYALELSPIYEDKVYDYYGTEYQGVVIPVEIGNEFIRVLVKYDLSNQLLVSTFSNLLIIILYCVGSIVFFSRSLSNDISVISKTMSDMINNTNSSLNKKLPVTTNDEIGDLICSFNQIQELTEQHITQIENTQQTLLEQERLASLGQMIGGIAHNLKTPIMSISGASEGLTELVGEYVSSINNPQVTFDDHRAIANDMLEWITKIKQHTSYMSDIITTVKGQASQLGTSEYTSFTVYDLTKKVDILVKHEIKKALLTLDTNIECSPSLLLHGDINNLIQVIINLISNAIQSYNGKPNEKVYFSISADEKNVYFIIKDNGCGMTDAVKEKLFKEMITTKGKNGTGLGLYMSYSTIKGKFGGNIDFSSELNVGTTFKVTIPLHKEE